MDKAGKKVRKRVKEKPFFPDEIITNILAKLPVKSLVRFELVCRKWRDNILARDFVDLHHRSSIPLIFVSPTIRFDFGFVGIDKWWDLSRSRSMIHRFPFYVAASGLTSIFSHAGLIVLDASPWSVEKIIIFNPSRPSDECVEIFFSIEFWSSGSRICAVYYHPLLEEYCSLWKILHTDESGHPEPTIEYRLLNLGSKPSFKTIHYSFSYQMKDEYASPLFINNHFYWMLKSEQEEYGGHNDILEFGIISEAFKVISCPVPLKTDCKRYHTKLLSIDGVMSFVLILPSTITIWRLEDREQQLWTSIEYNTSISKNYQDVDAYDIISVVDEKLAFLSGERLFVCDLMEGTVKNAPKRKWYGGNVSFLSHQNTLASLKKCKSPLYIDTDCKVFMF